MSLNTTPVIIGGSMPSRAIGSESVGIFTFNYTGSGTLSIQTSFDGISWHPASPLTILGATPIYSNWIVGSNYQPYSVVRVTPTVSGTANFYVRIHSVTNNTYSNTWFTSLTSFAAIAGGYSSGYAQGKDGFGNNRKRLVHNLVQGAAIDGAHTHIFNTAGSASLWSSSQFVETQGQTFLGGGKKVIVRYDAQGNVLWGRSASYADFQQAVQDESGNLYLLVTGFTLYVGNTETVEQTFPYAAYTHRVVKLNSQGQFVWCKTMLQTDTTADNIKIAVGGNILAIWTNQAASIVTWDGVGTTYRTNMWTSKVLLGISVETGAMLWNNIYNPTAAKNVANDSVSVNNWGYVAVHHQSDTAGGDWNGVALPTFATTSKISVFTNTGAFSYANGVLNGGGTITSFNSKSMFLKRSSSNVFVGVIHSASATDFRVSNGTGGYNTVQLPANGYAARLELGPLGLVSTRSFTSTANLSTVRSAPQFPAVDLGLGSATPWQGSGSKFFIVMPSLTQTEATVLRSQRAGQTYAASSTDYQQYFSQFDQHGNAYTAHGETFNNYATQWDLYVDLNLVTTSSSTQPANLLNTANRTGWGTLSGYPSNANPAANNGTEPPTIPVSSNWPASVPEGQSASGTITGYDPEGLAATTTGQGTVVPILQIWDPAISNWVNDPAALVISGFGTISSYNSGLLNIGSTVTFTPESANWYGTLGVMCRWKVGNRVSSIQIFLTTVVNTIEATDAPTGDLNDVFEGETVEGTFQFTEDPDFKTSYTWELSPQHTKPANWDTLYPPNQYPNNTQPDWHTTIAQTINVKNNANETMGVATVLSTNHPNKSAVIKFTSLPGMTGSGNFDVRVNNGVGSPWTTVFFTVNARPIPTFVTVNFPTVSESSYSQAQLSFAHVYEGVDIPSGSVSYEYEFTSDAGKPANWDTLYPPQNYPNGQPDWPVTWTASAQAIDNNDASVGLVNVQSEDDSNKTAVIRFTPIYGFTGTAYFDLRVKATWAASASRPLPVVRYSSIKSSGIQVTSIETPGAPTGSMPNANEDATSTGTWQFTYAAVQAVENYVITWLVSPQTEEPGNWDTLYPPQNYPYGQPDFHTTTGQTVTLLDEYNASIGTAAILLETDALKRTTVRFTPVANFNGVAEFDLRAVVTWPISATRPIAVEKYSPWVTCSVNIAARPDAPVLNQPVAPVVNEDVTSEFTITWTDVDKTAQWILDNGAAPYKVILNTTGSGIGTDQNVITTSKAIVRVINYSPNSLSATLRIEPFANATGSFLVYMRIQDDESPTLFSAYKAITVNILAVPDAPTPVQGSMPFALYGQSVSGTFTTTDPDSTYSHFVISSSFNGSYVKTLTAGNLTLAVVDSLTTDRQANVQLTQVTPHNLTSYGFWIRAYDVNSATYTTAGGLYSDPVFISGVIGTAAQGSDTGGGGQIVTPGPGGNGSTGIWGAAGGGTYVFPVVAGVTTVERLAPFTTVTALSVTETLDGSGFCEMTISAREIALRASQAGKTIETYLKAGAVELTINFGGSTFFVGVISETAWETDSGEVRISAQGLLSYFDTRIIPRSTSFVARNLSDLIADLVMGTQSFAYGDLAITKGTSQVSANGTFTFEGGTTISDAIGQVLDKVDAPEIWIGPDRVLRAEATRGVDNQARVRITSGVASVASWTRRNDGVITVAKVIGGPDGSGGFFSGAAGSVTGAQTFGLLEKEFEVPALLSNGECTALAQRVVDSFNEEVSALKVMMTLTPDRKFYLADLGIGNVVTVDLIDPTLGQIFGAYRIINRTVTLVDTAVGTYDVVLDLEPAKYVANKLIGSRSRHNPKLLTDSAKAEMLLRQG